MKSSTIYALMIILIFINITEIYAKETLYREHTNVYKAKFIEQEPKTYKKSSRISTPNFETSLKLMVTSPKKKIIGDFKTVVDAKVYTLDLPAKDLIGEMFWSEKADCFYALNKNGILYKISVPDFVITRHANFNNEVSDMGLSEGGLVVILNKMQEIIVIDPVKLTYKGSVPVAGAYHVSASPKSQFVFATREENSRELWIINTKVKKIVHILDAYHIVPPKKSNSMEDWLSYFSLPTVSSDGKYFFCESRECLHKFQINKFTGSLFYEEAGPRVIHGPRMIVISEDTRYICMPSSTGNSRPNLKGHPDIGKYGIYIYKVNNISRPVMSYNTGNYPIAMAFDKTGKQLYSQSSDYQLITMYLNGQKKKEYKLGPGTDDVRQFLVHPSGKKLLILTSNFLSWVIL